MIWIIGIIIFILVIFFTGGFDRKHNKVFIVTAIANNIDYLKGAKVTVFETLDEAKEFADSMNLLFDTNLDVSHRKLGVFKSRVFEEGDYNIGTRVY